MWGTRVSFAAALVCGGARGQRRSPGRRRFGAGRSEAGRGRRSDVGCGGRRGADGEALVSGRSRYPYPSPLPVREAAVETVPNHEDVGCSEHQIRLSKGLIAKFVQRKELSARLFFALKTKATAMVAFPVSVFSTYFQCSESGRLIWQVFVMAPKMGVTVTLSASPTCRSGPHSNKRCLVSLRELGMTQNSHHPRPSRFLQASTFGRCRTSSACRTPLA